MKVLRRVPNPSPDDARARALSRLGVRPATPAADGHLHDEHQEDEPEERDEQVRGGWIPEQVRPERLRDARWTLTPRHVVVLVVLLAVGLTWAGWSLFRARPEALPDTRPSTAATGSPVTPKELQTGSLGSGQTQPAGTNQPPGAATTPGQAVVVVHVAGKVRRPGLIRAPAGSRVADVLTLAGGALRGVDLTTLNLARQVTDGEQILVGQLNQPAPTNPSAATSSSPSNAANASVNLNTATLDQLDALPGVGPVLAQRILDFRTQNGPFTTIDQLQEVPGVGPKKFDSLKPHVHL
ncbi:helix-hairpin-helix domain-containing protein [Kribbella sp. NPDC054772]